MSYKHLAAKLIKSTDTYALYRYTSEEVDEEYWGEIRFPIDSSDDYEVIKYMKDGKSDNWKNSVCDDLARSFKKKLTENNGVIPEFLVFAA